MVKTIYILTPPNVATGGIELLHQVAYQINQHKNLYNYEAIICYPIQSIVALIKPQPDVYTERYDNPYVCRRLTELAAEHDATILFPEIWAFWTNNNMFKTQKKIIYWESVDNYYHLTPKELVHVFPDVVLHLTQSIYADNFLKSLQIPSKRILPLTDYISDEFFSIPARPSQNPRRAAAAFNSRKKYNNEFIEQLKTYDPSITYIPLYKYPTNELIDILDNTMLYIDFCDFAGKDRMPREAVVRGCCIITGKRGAAGIAQGDFFIPEPYRFDDKPESIPAIVKQIKYIFSNYNTCIEDFEQFKERVGMEKAYFKIQIHSLLDYLCKKQRSYCS